MLIFKLKENKDQFYKIFDAVIEKDGDFITCKGKITYDKLIDSHLKAWAMSRIYGVSASMAFYAEATEAIKLIDTLAKEYFTE